jgi:hypothetical protein
MMNVSQNKPMVHNAKHFFAPSVHNVEFFPYCFLFFHKPSVTRFMQCCTGGGHPK